jgi:hypothetical protein
MSRAGRLPSSVVAAVRSGKYFGVRAGGGDHKFTGIWMVDVDGRVFARSWTMKAAGWHRALVADPRGAIQVGTRVVRTRARLVRSERIKDAVSRAYFAKYDTPSSLHYCRGFARGRRRDSTIEFVPAGRIRS